jgi:hypothetical protein
MSKFVLRYSGHGNAQTQQVRQHARESVTAAGGRVLDVTGAMMLVECGAAAARSLRSKLPDWLIVEERKTVKRPRPPRPRVARSAA